MAPETGKTADMLIWAADASEFPFFFFFLCKFTSSFPPARSVEHQNSRHVLQHNRHGESSCGILDYKPQTLPQLILG